MIRLFFLFLSVVYVAVIFLFAGSPIVSEISRFNPHSLLHIPLYGILAVLLYQGLGKAGRVRFLLPGVIALGVGIGDEVNQIFTPGREASATDVILDLAGICLFLFFLSWLQKVLERRKGEASGQ
jgi:VanZ family protein